MDINWPELLNLAADLLVLGVIGKNCIDIKRISNRLNRLEKRKCA